MTRRTKILSLILGLCTLSGMVTSADDDQEREHRNKNNRGAVYTMDNATGGNHVLVFHRNRDGSLTAQESVATGGAGTGGGLGSQGSMISSRNGQWLIVCNAGSDEISVLAVTPHGLRLTDKVSSLGRQPISLTLHGPLLYVLNAGGAVGDQDHLTAFLLIKGKLIPLPDSTRSLSAANTGPAQISFVNEGRVLVVTEKATGILDTYTVDDDGLVDDHKMFLSPAPTPFGFAVGKHGRIFVTEAVGGAPEASSVSSYEISEDGDLEIITPSAPTTETAACWAVITKNQRYVYVTNTGSDTISGYRVNHEGELELLNADGRTGATGDNPIDVDVSQDSRFLYSLNSLDGTISAFAINQDGSLHPLPGASGLPTSVVGLVAE